MARGMFAAALLTACGQDATTTTNNTPTTSAASAYEALSARLSKCEDEKDACVTAAAGDATALAACDTAAASCEQSTQAAAADARKRLCDDTENCVRGNRCEDEDAGASDDSCRPGVRRCVERGAPALPACVDTLFACLDATGIRMSTAQTQIDDATRAAIVACVDAADSCIRDQMANQRRDRRGGRGPGRGGNFPGAGTAGASAAGSAALPSAGAGGSDDDGDRRGRGRGRGPGSAGAGGDDDNRGPGSAGSGDDDDDDNRGRGRGRGAAGEDHSSAGAGGA